MESTLPLFTDPALSVETFVLLLRHFPGWATLWRLRSVLRVVASNLVLYHSPGTPRETFAQLLWCVRFLCERLEDVRLRAGVEKDLQENVRKLLLRLRSPPFSRSRRVPSPRAR